MMLVPGDANHRPVGEIAHLVQCQKRIMHRAQIVTIYWPDRAMKAEAAKRRRGESSLRTKRAQQECRFDSGNGSFHRGLPA